MRILGAQLFCNRGHQFVYSSSLFETLIMASLLTRKGASFHNYHFLSRTFNLCFKSLTTIPHKDVEAAASSLSVPPSECSSSLHLSPFFSDFNHLSSGFDIELVDHDAWGVSSGVAQAWRGQDWTASGDSSFSPQVTDDIPDDHVEGEMDFDDIDNMRIRGNLFYKLERTSKEFEEYNLDFHRKKSSKKNDGKVEVNKAKTTPNETSKDHKLHQVHDLARCKSVMPPSKGNKLHQVHDLARSKSAMPLLDEINDMSPVNKRQRTPTFNQVTGPYHEPFCLDIYISKASVRACIVHRATSKVVAVAHSISKDIKFDLASTKNKTTCAAVGAFLAQRALADDIHDVIYTPRKGEKVEGKLQIVLRSIIDNGINVKVKIKQRPKKSFSRI